MERSLSVLLPVHNHQSTLAGQVQRILEVLPDLSGRFELIIIDDGSTDATIEVADELARRYPQIRVLRHAVPLGRLAALKSGLQASSGEVMLLYDEASGLSMKDVQRRWQVMKDARPTTPAAETRAPQHPPLWTELPPEERYQIVDRQAMKLILDQADCSAGSESATGISSRPKRPNYMARLREFALGE